MTALTRYAQTIRVPDVARLLVLGGVARLPMAMETVAVVLFVRGLGGSYGLAGAVTAGYTIGYAVAAPFLGRMADRHMPARVLWPLAVTHTAGMAALVVAGLAGEPGALLVALGLIAGASVPPTGAIARKFLVERGSHRRDLLPTIFALDSLCIEFVFMGGPLITAVLVAVASPAAALVGACVVTIIGVAGLVSMPALAHDSAAGNRGGPGALRSSGMRTLVGCAACVGVTYGAFQVSIIAFADDVEASWSAPWLLALFSLGGVCGVLAYGAFGHRFPSSTALAVGACVLPVCFTPIVSATSLAQMVPLAIIGGALMTPVLSITNQLVGDVAPPGAVTEAYSWILMAMLSGVSLGLTVGGRLIDSGSWRTGMSLAMGATVACAAVAVIGRGTLPDVGWGDAATKVS